MLPKVRSSVITRILSFRGTVALIRRRIFASIPPNVDILPYLLEPFLNYAAIEDG